MQFTITKADQDKQYVFGWASVARRADGTEVIDFEGDVVTPEELEKAAYTHVLNFRETGERHDPMLRSKGRLIESCVLTREKQKAIGIPEGAVPEGWWCGYHITDREAWEKIKSGEYRMFSVEGSGERADYTRGALNKAVLFHDLIEKFNPYHGKDGRFASRNAHVTFAPGKNEKLASSAIARENAKRAAEEMDTLVTGAYRNIANQEYGNALKAYLEQKKEEEAPITQVKAPVKAGKKVDWNSMSDDEFVQSLEDYMPGITAVANKGWASSHSAYSYEDSSLNGDMVLTDIYTARGFHGKPTIMDKDSIKAYIAQNGTPELYRGMGTSSHGQSGAEKQDRFANDPLHFAGYGVLGNGTYAAQTPAGGNQRVNTGLRVARNYASRSQDGCVRMTLQKGAKTATYPTLSSQRRDFESKLYRANRSGSLDDNTYQKLRGIVSDVGRFGALRGYDAWVDKSGSHSGATRNSPFWVITNRSKIIIQKERYS